LSEFIALKVSGRMLSVSMVTAGSMAEIRGYEEREWELQAA
jgi:hypothetical protein